MADDAGAGAGGSRRSIRPAWSAGTNEEEARAYCQARMIVFSRLMFWSFVVLMVFLTAMYREYPKLEPVHNDLVSGVAAVGLGSMAFIWRGLLIRRTLSLRTLGHVDLLYAMCIGTAFAASAVLAPELKSAAFTSLIFAYLSVFTRALIVPSSAPRTAVVSTAALCPLVAGAVILSLTTTEELPPTAYICGPAVISAVVVVIATTGSRIIYGLRRQVSEAMQLGQYTLDRKIGEGGMGAVYHAHHVLLRRPTAVKLLLPDRVGADNIDRFEREVRHMSRLTHPNTVAVYDYGRSPDGVFYYAMEYLGGGIDLENLVRRHGPQPGGRVADILAQVCGALQEAHDLGIIHRDIKPANIILCERGGMPDVAKVVDFGLVKEFATDTGGSAQVILGTPAYVAPEAITDPGGIGPAADLYALGAVGYYLLTGKRVFEGKSPVEVCIQHVTVAPKRPSTVAAIHVDEALEALIMQCLAKAPSERPASAAAFAEALRALTGTRDWAPADARRWWHDYRAAEDVIAVTSRTPTLTITVALDQRNGPDVRSA